MRVVSWVVALMVVVGLWVPLSSAPAQAASAALLYRPTPASTSIVLAGRAAPRATVRVQVRASRWTTVRKVRASRTGTYRVTVPYPSRVRYVRALASSRVSYTRAIRPRKTKTPTPTPTPTPTETPTTETAPPPDACGDRLAKRGGGYWSCSFNDDFEGTALDPAKWLAVASSFSGMTSGNKDCYPDGTTGLEVGSGVLELTSTRNLTPFVCRSPFGAFTSTSTAAAVVTKGRFSQTYGRFAFRAKFPARVVGSHSALWLYPDEHIYGGWPKSGEIDVAEWWGGRPANVYPSAHYAGEVAPTSTGLNCPVPTASSAFHTYAVEWTPTAMRFEYDGKLCFTHSWKATGMTGSAPFDKPFYLVLTQVWGGALWNMPSGDTTSSTLTVDWVRAWS